MSPTIIGILGLIFIATLSGWLLSRSKKVEKPVKIMLFVLYFWVSLFIQLIVFAVLYQFDLLSDFF